MSRHLRSHSKSKDEMPDVGTLNLSGNRSRSGSRSSSRLSSRSNSFGAVWMTAAQFLEYQEQPLANEETVYQPYTRTTTDVAAAANGNEEEMGQDSKTLIFALIKQVKIGMDLSRVVLPTFILEPKSMLEKVSDFLTHSELLVATTRINDPLERMVGVVKWYLSGFYLKPKGVKKPYNPVLGELFRCSWNHPESKSFFIGEQVSHHPPVSAFYASNRKEGLVANGSILFRSKFYGTSVGSILEGSITIHHIRFGEEYEVTFPSAYGKGFLFGTLVMELAGLVTITCKQSGLKAEIDFKQKPSFFGEYNTLQGKISRLSNNQPIFNLSGKWDQRIDLTDANNPKCGQILWAVTPEFINQKLTKLKPNPMFALESDALWSKVTDAIVAGDQQLATDEKANIEQAQRDAAAIRAEKNMGYTPRLFVPNSSGGWTYKWFNNKPWNPQEEDEEYEAAGIIATRKHRA
ncbi:hypothetical protein PROFUN_07223 [Planoprotostelium fungivorum]|uniref:Oxysterol-binding protein n=1 Tax=Planoprotostelium fungivorum TaxID=1890364 RepID=A0A2P6NM80_9EUKA|nr:hypothetical protein PROFUN_07223 [Planoprotostelium fungivorum]